jgi:hypothetical protein
MMLEVLDRRSAPAPAGAVAVEQITQVRPLRRTFLNAGESTARRFRTGSSRLFHHSCCRWRRALRTSHSSLDCRCDDATLQQFDRHSAPMVSALFSRVPRAVPRTCLRFPPDV